MGDLRKHIDIFSEIGECIKYFNYDQNLAGMASVGL